MMHGRSPSLEASDAGPAAVSWAARRIDLFWNDDADALWHRSFENGARRDPESLAGELASAPAVTAWAVDHMEVFAVHRWRRAVEPLLGRHRVARLGVPRRLPGLGRACAASSSGADRLDVFASGTDGAVWHRWWDGARWVEWEQLPA